MLKLKSNSCMVLFIILVFVSVDQPCILIWLVKLAVWFDLSMA